MSSDYVCPQCGPDRDGPRVHQLVCHTFTDFREFARDVVRLEDELAKLQALQSDFREFARDVVRLEDELAKLQALQSEQEQIVLGFGVITCRNGKQHTDKEPDCLYCVIARLREQIEKLSKEREEIAMALPVGERGLESLSATVVSYAARLREALKKHDNLVVDAFDALKKEIDQRWWLTEGRGDFRYDDDRYRDEFRYAMEAMLEIVNRVIPATNPEKLSAPAAPAAPEKKGASR